MGKITTQGGAGGGNGNFLPLTGGNLTGPLTLNSNNVKILFDEKFDSSDTYKIVYLANSSSNSLQLGQRIAGDNLFYKLTAGPLTQTVTNTGSNSVCGPYNTYVNFSTGKVGLIGNRSLSVDAYISDGGNNTPIYYSLSNSGTTFMNFMVGSGPMRPNSYIRFLNGNYLQEMNVEPSSTSKASVSHGVGQYRLLCQQDTDNSIELNLNNDDFYIISTSNAVNNRFSFEPTLFEAYGRSNSNTYAYYTCCDGNHAVFKNNGYGIELYYYNSGSGGIQPINQTGSNKHDFNIVGFHNITNDKFTLSSTYDTTAINTSLTQDEITWIETTNTKDLLAMIVDLKREVELLKSRVTALES